MKNARSLLFMLIVNPPPTIATLAFTIIWLVAEMFAVRLIVSSPRIRRTIGVRLSQRGSAPPPSTLEGVLCVY